MSRDWGLALAFTAGASQRDATASYGDWGLGICRSLPITHYPLPITH
ncbi:MAG: hypothetical protein AAFX80_08305 [Cyanobacteria bacterium J06639_18]